MHWQSKFTFIVSVVIIFSAGLASPAPAPTVIDGFGIGSGTHLRIGAQILQSALDHQQEMGIRWTREDLPWAEVEPSPDMFRWEYGFQLENGQSAPRDFVRLISEAGKRDIEVILILDYRPSYLPDNVSPEEFLARWENYVQHAVDKFGDQVDYWEIQNEPNSRFFWGKVVRNDGTSANIDSAYYSRILRSAYRIIKQKAPTDQVLIGGLVTMTEGDCATNPFVYLKRLHDLGAWNSFDIISFHPYWWPNPPEQVVARGKAHELDSGSCLEQTANRTLIEEVRQMRRLAEQFGAKPIWITEIGWNEIGLLQRANERGTVSDIVEADYLVRTYVPLLSEPGIDKVFWYTQYESVNSGEDFTLGEIGQQALSNLSFLLTSSVPIGQYQGQNDHGNLEDDDVYEYRFEKDGKTIIIAWKARGGDAPREVIFQNINSERAWQYGIDTTEISKGTAKELVVSDATLSTELSERPIIIIFDGGSTTIPSGQETPPDDDLKWWQKLQKDWTYFWDGVGTWWNELPQRITDTIDGLEAWWRDLPRRIEEELLKWLLDWLDKKANKLCGAAGLVPVMAVVIYSRRRIWRK